MYRDLSRIFSQSNSIKLRRDTVQMMKMSRRSCLSLFELILKNNLSTKVQVGNDQEMAQSETPTLKF